MSRLCTYGFFTTVVLTGLTACGGATSPSIPASEVLEPVAAPALDNVPLDSNADLVVPDVVELETPPTDSKITDPQELLPALEEEVPFTPDQIVLGAASDVTCDADAALFNVTMLELINASRSEARMCGVNQRAAVPTVQWNDTLTEAAVLHANDMVSNNFFSHDGSDGLGVSDRATAAGYNWRAVGENIAAGQVDQAEVHQGWLDSEGHCKNIMNSSFTEVGAACVSDPGTDFGTYWVVVFGDSK